jgi:hypothetical protein
MGFSEGFQRKNGATKELYSVSCIFTNSVCNLLNVDSNNIK